MQHTSPKSPVPETWLAYAALKTGKARVQLAEAGHDRFGVIDQGLARAPASGTFG
jgi:hypothetical protein